MICAFCRKRHSRASIVMHSTAGSIRSQQCQRSETVLGEMDQRRGATPRLSSELFQECLGLLEVGGIKALGKPTVDRREELVSLSALALLLPQASQAHGSAQAVVSLGSAPRGNIVDRD